MFPSALSDTIEMMASVNEKVGVSIDVADGRILFPSSSKMMMNEKVQNLATIVYQEFEKMISKYDANVVKGLMPIIVDMLESLESAYIKADELEIQTEMMTDDIEQLESEYQKEKKLRIGAAERHLELEDTLEAHQEESNTKLSNLNSVIKTYELKSNELENHASNLSDQEKHQIKNEKISSNIIDDTQDDIDQLMITKHALSTVKDDLVRNIDRLMIENDDLEEENRSLQEKKSNIQRQIKGCEAGLSNDNYTGLISSEEKDGEKSPSELNITLQNELNPFEVDQIRDRVQELESAVNAIAEESPSHISRKLDEDDNFWDAEGNHFTWSEMEGVLLEKNQYKVQYMELQEAIRWTATMNATKAESKSSRMTLFGSRPKKEKGKLDKKETDQRHFKQNNNAIRRFFSKFS